MSCIHYGHTPFWSFKDGNTIFSFISITEMENFCTYCIFVLKKSTQQLQKSFTRCSEQTVTDVSHDWVSNQVQILALIRTFVPSEYLLQLAFRCLALNGILLSLASMWSPLHIAAVLCLSLIKKPDWKMLIIFRSNPWHGGLSSDSHLVLHFCWLVVLPMLEFGLTSSVSLSSGIAAG